ncbi:AbrB/MazE/SpoVT family DNA-binding domain-containing protein [Vulcanisaeta souniana]|uniref:AbrB family transcriptional regulator n=1 Tax=Vulcanisaeta souniana JCM 11219 TaxID=1293586 RepID=A0A830E2Z5_9CREN|nr:AbrB/MazE/SpoVT family DNA-binding domain-containing protein [Vulcanisaeta souniana]BDR93433.1 hypothetical protein Vsou_25260 [Vulcanisaeta souniana JCM 11219]GGI77063.1 hypothetical protein GCM10007112_12360 [Vulcanisaeta souniana JCM 11219]
MVLRVTIHRRTKRINVVSLPYLVKVYINNQVLLPASLVRALGLSNHRFVNIELEYKGFMIELRNVRLLRTRHTDSRQFTIPRDVRKLYGIGPSDIIKILSIEPSIVNQ